MNSLNTKIKSNVSRETIHRAKLNPKIETKINDSKNDLLGIVAFQHIREELEKFNDGNHMFIIHQTDEENANNIMQSLYFSRIGLVGTSLIANLDTIINTCYFLYSGVGSAPNFQRHRGSNSLVIIIINKNEFKNQNGEKPRNLNDIDSKLLDYVEGGEINSWGLPNSCIWGYVNGVSYHKNHNFTGKIGHYK